MSCEIFPAFNLLLSSLSECLRALSGAWALEWV
jgi:hypothetical protein